MSLIQLQSISKHYSDGTGTVRALSDVSLALEAGDFVSVVGESGSGKSTLLTVLGGLNRPSGGTLTVDGIDVYALPSESQADFRREYIGFVFQSFHLIQYLTVIENVLVPLTVCPIPASEKMERARALIEQVGLGSKARRLPGQLSGGEQERVAIARALANDAPVIIADEPTGNLDSATGEAMMDIFRSLASEGRVVVMATHNLAFARRSDRIIELADGRVKAQSRVRKMEVTTAARG